MWENFADLSDNNRWTEYTDAYIEKCFVVWYENQCTSIKKYLEADYFPPDELGRKPSLSTLASWFDERGWWIRKDELDARASIQIDDKLVAQKVMMLEEQAAIYRQIRKKAADHLLENPFDSSAAAVSALVKASQEERIVRGISKTIQRLAELGDDELMKEIKELAERAGADVIDVGEVTEDAESPD